MPDQFEHPWLLLALIVLNFPVYRMYMVALFGDSGGLKESLWYWLTPDIISAFRGEFWDDRWATGKLIFFIVMCVLTVAAEYTGITKLFAC